MKNNKKMEDENRFIGDFIQHEMYLQNPPMVTEDFINYCEKLGVYTSEEELEFFEKEELLFPVIRVDRPVEVDEKIKFRGIDGLEYLRPVEYGLQEGETEIERIKVKSYAFYNLFKEDIKGSYYKDGLLNWFEEGNLFEPASRELQSWDNFLGEELEGDKQKIVSFYSNFQIWQLRKLKQITSIRFTHEKGSFSIDDQDIAFEDGKIYLNLKVKMEFYNEAETRQLERPFKSNPEIKAEIEQFRRTLDLNEIRDNWHRYDEFQKFLRFLLSVQTVYLPYAKSGSGRIQLSMNNSEKWAELKHNFKLDTILEQLDIKIEDVGQWYKIFADEAQRILGIKRDDWLQLFKSISWDKKDNLEGHTRLGLEYLHWAIMLKRILEEHLRKKVLDIDELSGVAYNDILKYEPGQLNDLQASEDKKVTKTKDYGDFHKRLFYLANKFGLDYQPRVTVYVEGGTEEIVFPEIYEDYFGVEPENLGIEFISIRGISQFFGRRLSISHQGKYKTKFVSNFNNLASYNLNKWQIIPFFIGDDENDISNLMQRGISISFNGKQFAFPKEWQYIWGITNDNKPFRGKDFEIANYDDEELAAATSEVLGKKINPTEVKSKRNSGEGLKQVDKEIDRHKVDIARILYINLINKHEKTRNPTLLKRPIFDVLKQIRELAVLNHPPTSRKIQLKNKEYIEGILQQNT